MHAVSIKEGKSGFFFTFSKVKSRNQSRLTMAFIIHFVAALCLIHLSTGQDCRTVNSVINSASDVQTNVYAGGHIWQHIAGLASKPQGASPYDTQYQKTLFNSQTEFTNAFASFQTLTGGMYVTCPAGGAAGTRADSVLASSINIQTAKKCTAVYNNQLCSNSFSYNMQYNHYIIFCYKYYYGQWIMRTSYPKYNVGPMLEKTMADECAEEFLTEYENKGANEISRNKNLIELLLKWLLDW